MRVRILMVVCVCAVLLSLAGSAFAASTPPGSFITKPVKSPSELAKLVQQDRVTALRYSKHYGMEPTELSKYFQENLTLSTLSETKDFTVYFIAKNGKILSHKKRLKAGEQVFVAANGQPVIAVKCGNPMSAALPKVVAKVQPTTAAVVTEQVKPVEVPAPAPVVEPEPAPTPVPVVEQPVEVTTPEPPLQEVLVAVEPEPVPAEPEPIQEAVLALPPLELPAAVPVPVEALTSNASSWLVPAVLGAGAIGALVGGSNDPVPEPASILVLSIGGLGLVAQGYRLRRRR